jgi:Flp pilus assembly CpaE family ATPase
MEGDFFKRSRTEWRVLLVCPNPELRATVAKALADLGVRDVTQMATYPERYGVESILDGRQICLIDASSDQLLALPLIERIAAANVSVIALHSNQNPELQLQCLRRGVSESLASPIDTGQLQCTLERVAARRQYGTRVSRQPGAVYAVMSGKGGAGSTALATHLALRLADARPRKVLLVDLNGITGSTALLVKAKPAFSLVEVASNLGRMDEDLWNNLAVRQGPLDLLLAPQSPTPLQMQAEQLSQLLDFWRNLYDAVILDLPGTHHELSFGLARLSDLLLLVSTCNLGSLYATARTRTYLESCGVRPEVIKIVLNRFKPAFALKSWDEVVGQPVFARVTDAGEALEKALLEGKLTPTHSKFRSDITALAQEITHWPLASKDANKGKPNVVKPWNGGLTRLFAGLRAEPPLRLFTESDIASQ